MTVTELTKEIYNKYPKVWNLFENYVYEKYDFIYWDFNMLFIIILKEKQRKIPFFMLYGFLEDFFEENCIVITLDWRYISFKDNYIMWNYDITKLRDGGNGTDGSQITEDMLYIFKSKQEAKMQAILKACEILENKLNYNKYLGVNKLCK